MCGLVKWLTHQKKKAPPVTNATATNARKLSRRCVYRNHEGIKLPGNCFWLLSGCMQLMQLPFSRLVRYDPSPRLDRYCLPCGHTWSGSRICGPLQCWRELTNAAKPMARNTRCGMTSHCKVATRRRLPQNNKQMSETNKKKHQSHER